MTDIRDLMAHIRDGSVTEVPAPGQEPMFTRTKSWPQLRALKAVVAVDADAVLHEASGYRGSPQWPLILEALQYGPIQQTQQLFDELARGADPESRYCAWMVLAAAGDATVRKALLSKDWTTCSRRERFWGGMALVRLRETVGLEMLEQLAAEENNEIYGMELYRASIALLKSELVALGIATLRTDCSWHFREQSSGRMLTDSDVRMRIGGLLDYMAPIELKN